MIEEEYKSIDILYLNATLEKFKEKFNNLREQQLFALGYLVSRGYSFEEAEELLKNGTDDNVSNQSN